MRITAKLVGKAAAVIVGCCAGSMALSAQTGPGRNSQNDYESACQNEMTRTVTELPATENDEEVRQLPEAVADLTIHSETDGGISIRGSERTDIVVVACKHVAAKDRATARLLLSLLRLRISGGEVGVDGFENTPDSHAAANLVVFAPATISLHLQTKNGGIDLNGVRGKIEARSENGGIFFHGAAGDADLNSRNGGIEIALQGSAWLGRGLHAHSDNGGLTIRVPPDFSSGILAKTDSDQLDCKAEVCVQGVKTWEAGSRFLQIGHSTIAIRASTDHAPVAILPAGVSD